MSDSFQILRGSSIRLFNRRVCSWALTSSQYLITWMPESTIAFSTIGVMSRKRSVCSGVQKPITGSTPARLYQLRSKITTSPAAGKCDMYRWRYICDFSRSVGAGNATTRNVRGLTRSVIRLIGATLAGRVTPFENDADLRSGGPDPLLHRDELALEHLELGLVLLAPELAARFRGCRFVTSCGDVTVDCGGDLRGASCDNLRRLLRLVLLRSLLLSHGRYSFAHSVSGLVAGAPR